MVDLFFVLSGFVITHSYHARLTTATELGRFVWLRFWRLYPLHFVFFLAFVFIGLARFESGSHSGLVDASVTYLHYQAKPILANIFLLHSAGATHSLSFNYPSWSISAEFINYVLYAALVRYFRNGCSFVKVAIFVISLSFATLLYASRQALGDFTFSWGVVRCTAGFFCGSIAWFTFVHFEVSEGMQRSRSSEILPVLAISAAAAFTALVNPHSRATYLFPALCAVLVYSLAQTSNDRIARALTTPCLLWLGRVSYSIYMVHALVNRVISKSLLVTFHERMVVIDGEALLDTSTIISLSALVCYIGAVLGLSQLTFKLIEEQFRQFARSSCRI